MKNWDDIRLVTAVVRQGGLSPAARVLGISHSTLSRRIQAIEEALGSRLFERVPHGLIATEAGKEIAAVGARVSDEISGLDLQLAGRDEGMSGLLRVTVPGLVLDAYAADMLRDFAEMYPEIDLHINASVTPVNLARREADVAIRATNDPPEVLVGRKMVGQRRAVYAARNFLESNGFSADDPVDVFQSWLGFTWWAADHDLMPQGARILTHFDDMAALSACLRAGMGVARLPCFIGESYDELVRLSAFGFEDYVDVWVLTHPSLNNVARVRAFMRFVAQRFVQDRALFEGTKNPGA